ncbi:MAG TPA: selenocysteine-specific translation elongation factor [Deltaproteobacteria bacterium]|nr:selenocysteine-specific translation elongation factor [Deltaproteobacteria bacterium]
MKHIVLGTAGHVDHGKTTLVKALTDIDTDRLKEEKKRGITIELGFAPLKLDEETLVGIVDVPGHERFVKNMVAGAAGIDMVALIIAADEGVMPQTREHLSICELLNVRLGLVALTKTDLVDKDWLDLVLDDIHTFLEGSFLEGAPIIPLCAQTGNGLSDFLEALRVLVLETEKKSTPDIFRLPVDRVFTMKGFGTVVTGTLLAGKVAVGDTVSVLPSGLTTKVRGIQVHKESRPFSEAGFRTAVNFQGISKEAVGRGDTITHPDIFEPTLRMDVFLKHLAGARKALKNRAPVRFHLGTAELMARIHLGDRNELAPGEETYAQVILETPAVAMAGDRFVIRSYSPITTIGGGYVIDPYAVKPKKRSHAAPEEPALLDRGNDAEKTRIILQRTGLLGIPLNRLVTRTGIPHSRQRLVLEDLFSRKEALLVDRDEQRAIAWTEYENLMGKIRTIVEDYHRRFPLKKGPAKEEVRISLGAGIAQKLFNKALLDLENRELLTVERDTVTGAHHNVHLDDGMGALKDAIAQRYREAGLAPPSTKEILAWSEEKDSDTKMMLQVLLDQGTLVKLNDDMLFDSIVLEKLRSDYRKRLLEKHLFSPADFKELTGLSRKYVIPLMEYFDKTNLTIRVGNDRILREKEKP